MKHVIEMVRDYGRCCAEGLNESAARELAAIRAALSLPAAAPEGVKPGWKLVPIEPSMEMLEGLWGEIHHGEPEIAAAKEAYAAMLAASPSEGSAGDAPKCPKCNGTGVVDDGEITGSGGAEFMNGPIKCMKDCPACGGKRAGDAPAAVQPEQPKSKDVHLTSDCVGDASKTALLPCPFCGGKAAFVPRAVNLALQKDPSDPKFGVSVICGRCSAESANMVDEAHATKKWNQREGLAE